MSRTGLEAKRILDADDIAQVRDLADACSHADGIEVKLNWPMIAERDAGRVNDLCYYQGDALIGYMPLDDFGGKYEITALVAPSHRRKGIFRAMFEIARTVLRERGASEVLLVNYRHSKSGCAAVARLGTPYVASEYCMEAVASGIPAMPPTKLQLERVTNVNVAELSRMLQITFEEARWSTADRLLKELANPDKRYYLARLENRVIGQIGIILENERVYIRAVGIAPQWRGKGYGRQLLASLLQILLKEGRQSFELDVATNNIGALSLYKSCGFRETNVYDYHSVSLPGR